MIKDKAMHKKTKNDFVLNCESSLFPSKTAISAGRTIHPEIFIKTFIPGSHHAILLFLFSGSI